MEVEMGKGRTVLLNGKEFMLIGTIITITSGLFGLIGLPIFVVGGLLYAAGLYFWSIDVDSRPLLFFVGETALIAVGALVLNMLVYRMELSPVFGFKTLVLSLLVLYPFIVASAVLYRIRMGLFAEETGELNFNLAGNLALIGALLLPLLIGIPLYNIGKLVEFFSLWKVPLVGTKTDGLPFVSLKKIAGIALVTLVLGGTLYYFIKPDYDFGIIKKDQKVALYGNFYDHGIELELVYIPRTCGDAKYKPEPDGSFLFVDSRHPCNVKIYVDGREIYSPGHQIQEIKGVLENLFYTRGVVSIKKTFLAPKNASTVVVSFEGENVTFQIPRD